MPPAQFIKLLKKIKNSLTLNFPLGGSSISEDITFKVLDAYFSGAELSVKNLFADLPYSVMGTRNHFDRLIKGGWIECRKSPKDARVRLVVPTDDLLNEINILSHNFEMSLLNMQLITNDKHTEFVNKSNI